MLTDREREILDFEEKWIDQPVGRRELATIDTLGMSTVRHTMILGRLLEREDALAEYPQLVYRLRARREQGMLRRDRRLLRRDA